MVCGARYWVLLIAFTSLAGCTTIPQIPNDNVSLPVEEILLATSCELRDTFAELAKSKEYTRFKPTQWLVTSTLTPKIDTDFAPGFGYSRKGPYLGVTTRTRAFNLASPGFGLDTKTERTGAVTYSYASGDLIKDQVLKKNCKTLPALRIHALTQEVGIKNWLKRAADATKVSKSVKLDKPSLNSDITIKFSGNGNWTYTFPAGTDVVSLGASYTLDEQLNISMAPIPEKQKLTVVSLPARPGGTVIPATTSIQSAQQRLDIIQLEQAIRSLQPRP